MVKVRLLLFCFSLSCAVVAAQNTQLPPGYKSRLIATHEAYAAKLAQEEALLAALARSFSQPVSLEEILKTDQIWSESDSLKNTYCDSPLAQRFRAVVKKSEYAIAEILLVDGFGALVACYPVATDFWQGDEEKFSAAVLASGSYVSEAAWDQSTRVYSFFISQAVKSNENKLLGVLIMGVDVTPGYLSNMSLEGLMTLQVKTESDQ